MQKTEGFFTIDGNRLEYRLFSPAGDGELTLVLLHEGLGCVAMWKDFPQELSALTGCQVLVYSRAGYGSSDSCSLPRPVSFMHDEALDVLPQVLVAAGISRAVLIGHSDGASIALIHAGKVADPIVQGLVLMAPHVFVEEMTLSSIRAAVEAYAKGDLRRGLMRYHGEKVDETFNSWSQVWLDPAFREWNLESCLASIRVPVLLIQGADDPYGSCRQLDSIAEQISGPSSVHLLPYCKHAPCHEQRAATLELIARFLSTITR